MTSLIDTMVPVTHEDRNFFHELNEIYLGDYVQDHVGRRGRVYDVHFSCPESDQWLSEQRLLPGADPMAWKKARWVSILLHESGSVVIPEQLLTVVAPFKLDNGSAGLYFRPF